MAMKPLSLFLFLFFFFHLSSGFLGFWGGEEEEKEKSVFEELWLNIPPRYHTQIFEKLKADPSFSSLIKVKSTGVPIETMSHRSGAHFSAKVNRGDIVKCGAASTDLGSVDVYRMGKIESLPFIHGCTTYRDLLETARSRFQDQNIHLFWKRDGTPIFLDNFVTPLPPKSYKQVLIATGRLGTAWEGYKEQERFYFPALEVGEVVPLSVPGNDGQFQQINLTTMSIHPKIFMLDPYMSQKECNDLWDYMNNLPKDSATEWERSSVGQDASDKAENTTTRVSYSLWLGDVHRNRNDLTSRLFTRSQTLLHAPMELMEPFQCVRYPPGGHYYFHTDSVPADRLRDNPNPYYRNGGNRYATLLIYVNAPSQGGHTAFPLAEDPNFSFDKTLSLEEHPTEGCNAEKAFHVGVKKGAAVLFYDLKEEQHMKGVIDPLSEHAGCDTSGEEPKVIMNQWYRNKRVRVGEKWHMYDNNW